MKTLVKICGITNVEDAVCAVECGADVLGFVFYKKSPRYISFDSVKKICSSLPGNVKKAGVFVNENPDELDKLHKKDYLDYFQFSGDEPAGLNARYPGKVIKTVRVSGGGIWSVVSKSNDCSFILCDTAEKGQYGGTGKTFDWDILKRIKFPLPLILAGGLNGDNVERAILSVRPYMVDVSSGVELSPGKKNPEKIKRFFEACRNADKKICNSQVEKKTINR